MKNRGFTLIEIIIVMALTAGLGVFVSYFAIDVSKFGTDLTGRLEADFELQLTFRTMISEIRSMGPGGNGAYPVATATNTTFSFYSNIDSDASFELVRYFLSGNILKKGVINPTATEPITYPPAQEVITDVVHFLTNGTIFTYYPEGLPGDVPALVSPADVAKVRLISISGTVDKDSAQSPLPTTLSITVTIRNLRGEI